jgi:ferredoxin-type protein NapG
MAVSDSPSDKTASDPALGRRTFLRHSIVSLGATVKEFVKHRDAPSSEETQKTKVPEKTGWLRPPGAVEEDLFLERCTKCGDCIDACPHDAIGQLPVHETPGIFPGETPCQLCDDFPCIQSCEADALMPIKNIYEVRMGIAKVSQNVCTAGNGCNACVPKCPTGAISMDFGAFLVAVDEGLCVGCGICQYICGTVNDRAAIRVVSRVRLCTK